MEKQQVEIEQMAAMIEGTEKGLMHERVLEPFMALEHYESLLDGEMENENMFSTKKGSCLPYWLDLDTILATDDVPEPMDVDGGTAQPVEPMNVDGAEEQPPVINQPPGPGPLIDVEDEARAFEEQRRLNVDGDYRAEQRHQHEMRQRRYAQQADERLAVNFDEVEVGAAGHRAPPGVANNQEWTTQGKSRKKRRQRLNRCLHSTEVMSEEAAAGVFNIWELTVVDRWKLYRYWVQLYMKHLKDGVEQREADYQIHADRLHEITEEEDQAIMQQMTVIGMTTTGAARYKNALKRIQPKIIIVEEAAEVLEAHIITTLSAGCEHLILIGDHKQLRPGVNVYKLVTYTYFHLTQQYFIINFKNIKRICYLLLCIVCISVEFHNFWVMKSQEREKEFITV